MLRTERRCLVKSGLAFRISVVLIEFHMCVSVEPLKRLVDFIAHDQRVSKFSSMNPELSAECRQDSASFSLSSSDV